MLLVVPSLVVDQNPFLCNASITFTIDTSFLPVHVKGEPMM
jgi:hypothetical protein